jgi:nucleoside-diphosphate-sugar epimerase
MNTHVVFGTGPLGRAVITELVARGRSVRAVNRRGKMQEAPAGLEVVAGNVYDASHVRRLTTDAAVVYQCAQPAYTEWPEKFPPLIHSVLEGLAGVNAKLVFGDNLYMYGDTDGQPLQEHLPWNAQTRKGRTRAQVAEAVLTAHRAGNVRATIGRASDFFGPFVLGSLLGERAFYPALKGQAAQMTGNLDVPHTATYIEDFGKALVLLGERDEALGQVWHVPNDQPTLTQRQFIHLVFQEIGRPPKISRMGKPMLSVVGLFMPVVREVVEMMYEFEKPFVVDSSKFEQTFGLKATPLREALRKTIAWYRAHPPTGHNGRV